MNLTLSKLRNKIKRDKSGMGSLIGVILGGVVLSTIVASGTAWYISMRANLGNTEDKLEAQTIAMSEWERLSHMSLDELEANRNVLKNPYSAGTDSQFSVSVNLGQKGTFNNGTCGAVSGGYANCFKDTTITVYRDGNRMFTTRTLPLMAGDYTRKEIDAKLSAEASARSNKDTDLQNQINNLTARLNGKEFIKNKTPNYDLNLRYEKKAGEDKFTLHAYNGNTEIPLASQGDTPSPELFNDQGGYYKFPNGLIMQWGHISGIYVYDLNGNDAPHITFPIAFPTKTLNVTLSIYAPTEVSNGISNVYSHNINRFGSDVITDAYSNGLRNATIYWYALGY